MAWPEITGVRWQEVDAIFSAAVERSGEAREDYLAQACAGRDDLRAAVDRMLVADAEADDFLAEPVTPVEMFDGDLAENVAPGTLVGPYRLLELLGEGGMGAVYRAERADEAFEREVAIKILRMPFADSEALARFRAERELLAQLDHPNIARLLDGGAAEGRPYLVMERVDGVPIDRYVAAHGLGMDARLGLIRQVCDAVLYAHRNLLIHRDIKPANVLVTDDGTVKLLDFGIAKLLGGEEGAAGRPLTRTGQRAMTPGYASPEQIRSEPVTTASDVFLLGILLHELVTGAHPFSSPEALPHEVERAICDGRPALARAGELGGLSAPRREELLTVIGKALSREPERRYGSVEGLAEDLERFQEHRPVTARPSTLRYRARSFIRRHRVSVSIAGLAAVAVIVFLGLLFGQSRRLAHERDRAKDTLAFLLEMFESADPERLTEGADRPRRILDAGAARIDGELGDYPEMQATLNQTVGRLYASLGWHEAAISRLEQAMEGHRTETGDELALATSLLHAGKAYQAAGDYSHARRLLAESAGLRRRALGAHHADYAESLAAVGEIDMLLNDLDAAEARLDEALRIQRAAIPEALPQVADTLMVLGGLLNARGAPDPERVVDVFREALAIREQVLGTDALRTADANASLALALYDAGRGDEAWPLLQRFVEIKRTRLGADHPDVASALMLAGQSARRMGYPDQAEEALTEALAVASTRLGENHPETANAKAELGILLLFRGRLDAAERLLLDARSVYVSTLGEGHTSVGAIDHFRTELLRRRGDLAAARQLLDHTLGDPAAHPPTVFQAYRYLSAGRLRLASGDPDGALTALTHARTIFVERGVPDWRLAEVDAELGLHAAATGQVAAGIARVRHALERLEATRPPTDTRIAQTRRYLAKLEGSAAQE